MAEHSTPRLCGTWRACCWRTGHRNKDPRESHESPTKVLRKSHESPTKVPRKSHESPTKVPQKSHKSPTKSHESPTKVPRKSHESPTKVPRKSHGGYVAPCGTLVGLSWDFCGTFVGLAWDSCALVGAWCTVLSAVPPWNKQTKTLINRYTSRRSPEPDSPSEPHPSTPGTAESLACA